VDRGEEAWIEESWPLEVRSGLLFPQLYTNLPNLNCKHKHTEMPNYFSTAEHKTSN
jgi:hypothetical protein